MLWSTVAGAVVELGVPNDWENLRIYELNADGSAFVGTATDPSTSASVSFLWQEGDVTVLESDEQGRPLSPYGLSDDAQLVLGGLVGQLSEAALWDEEKGSRTVLAELESRGLELPIDLRLPVNGLFMSGDGKVLAGVLVTAPPTPTLWRVKLLD